MCEGVLERTAGGIQEGGSTAGRCKAMWGPTERRKGPGHGDYTFLSWPKGAREGHRRSLFSSFPRDSLPFSSQKPPGSQSSRPGAEPSSVSCSWPLGGSSGLALPLSLAAGP